jgi:LysM repeat protein
LVVDVVAATPWSSISRHGDPPWSPGSVLAGTGVSEPVATEQVKVHSGQTLWGIAAASAPADADVRDVIIDIRELNGLETSAVFAGQQLTVPSG